MATKKAKRPTRRIRSLKTKSLAPKKARDVRGGSVEGGHATSGRQMPQGPAV
jgi:hypothetical protein